ncbi:MAG TPA: PKD domain-containing protein [Chitinophagaceae bacterium]|nr:PKD domain-containing protein [Chitinophagaceae bacterium]
MKQFLLSLAIIVLFATCTKKTLPESTTGDPLFMFSGNVNNIPVTYTAGQNSLYMHTEFYKDDQDLVTLKGFFAPHNCTTCEPYLGFEFKDENQNIETKLYADINSFFERTYFNSVSFDSLMINSPTESFKFIPDNNPQGTTYLWQFGDGDTSTLLSPIHTYTTSGEKDVRLITTLNNVKDTITIPIDVTPFSTCRNKFYTTSDTNNTITANAEGLFNSYVWFFGDGTANGEGQSVTHTFNANNIFEVTLKTSHAGCIATYKRRINFTGNNQIPIANYYYSNFLNSETKLIPRINHSTCVITLKIDGKTYKSYKTNPTLDQSNQKVITINSIAPYENNLDGNKTLQLNAAIDLFLYNINNNNDSIPIKSNQLNIAIAYPS